jgi:hypothetical protein
LLTSAVVAGIVHLLPVGPFSQESTHEVCFSSSLSPERD